MGFDTSDLRFLLSGINGKSICTLGRQNLFAPQSEINKVLISSGRKPVKLPERAILFAEDVLAPLGYSVESMDASAYEDATLVHDLNTPIPDHLYEKYDIVWDGGTLEHVFNFPTALVSAMRMVKVGGNIVFRTPANNLCGHGFYQFSPELFFRVLVPRNGFELVRVYMESHGNLYHVIDPAVARGRVELFDNDAALLMVHAKKIGSVPTVLVTPQQSDYVAAWRETKQEDGKIKSALRRFLSPSSIAKISQRLNRLRQRRNVWRWKSSAKLTNTHHYRQVRDWGLPSREAFKERP